MNDREKLYLEVIRELVSAFGEYDPDPVTDPEAYAAIYNGKAVLDPERYSKDHPVIAAWLAPLAISVEAEDGT